MKFLILLLTFISNSFAKHLGDFGPTFAIGEKDLLATITAKLHNLVATGGVKQQQIKWQARIAKQIARPPKVAGLVKTKVSKVFWYNPSIHVPGDLKDDKGRVFAKATVVNPLDYVPWRTLLFIDGDDAAQLRWVKQAANNGKIILVNGSPVKCSQKLQQPCYFDQHGKLVKKFGITQIPAMVQQNGKQLKIVEVLLDE